MKYRYYVCGFLFSALFLASGCGNLASNVVTEEQESQAETIQESTPAEITEVSEPSATEAITTEMILETEEESPTQQDSEEDVVWIEELNEIKYATDNVNIRSQATKDSDRLGSFGWGDEVEVTGRTTDGKWYRIRLSDTEGFVSAIYLSDIKPEREQATASEADEEEIEIREETETEEEVETEEEESATEEAETEEETEISPVPEHSFAGQLSISEGLEQLVIVEAKTNDSRQ